MTEVNVAVKAKNVDRHVGQRVRERRVQLGLTQEDLARELLISYQQVQKYETSANRISAGKLYVISKKLGVPVEYFFEELTPAGVSALEHGGKSRATIEVAKNFDAIRNPAVKTSVANLLKTVSRAESKPELKQAS